jgi:hypothetical protein
VKNAAISHSTFNVKPNPKNTSKVNNEERKVNNEERKVNNEKRKANSEERKANNKERKTKQKGRKVKQRRNERKTKEKRRKRSNERNALALFPCGFNVAAFIGRAKLTLNTLPFSSFRSILSIASCASLWALKVMKANPRCLGAVGGLVFLSVFERKGKERKGKAGLVPS